MDAGHSGSTGRFEPLKETALVYAFMLDLAYGNGTADGSGGSNNGSIGSGAEDAGSVGSDESASAKVSMCRIAQVASLVVLFVL